MEQHDLGGWREVFAARGPAAEMLAQVDGELGNVELVSGHRERHAPGDQSRPHGRADRLRGKDDHAFEGRLDGLDIPADVSRGGFVDRPSRHEQALVARDLRMMEAVGARDERRQAAFAFPWNKPHLDMERGAHVSRQPLRETVLLVVGGIYF